MGKKSRFREYKKKTAAGKLPGPEPRPAPVVEIEHEVEICVPGGKSASQEERVKAVAKCVSDMCAHLNLVPLQMYVVDCAEEKNQIVTYVWTVI